MDLLPELKHLPGPMKIISLYRLQVARLVRLTSPPLVCRRVRFQVIHRV
jgi:hypothetical protein